MDLQLQGKLALVTASTAGIGFAIAQTLAREGARVIVNGRTQAGVDAALAQLSGLDVTGFAGDLGTAAAADAVTRQFPDIDILVNNLGIFEFKKFADISDADWTRLFEVNVMSGVRLARFHLDRMKARNWGRIIFIASESATNVPTELIHYAATKAAQIAIARGLAQAAAGTGVTVNSVLPGPTHSRGTDALFAAAVQAGKGTRAELEAEVFRSGRPGSIIRRFAEAEEVAAMVAYIASPLSSATTGAALRVEGGVIQSAF